MTVRACRGCGVELPFGGRGRPQVRCSDCRRAEIAAKQRAYRAANKAEIAAKQRAYYAANKAEIAAKKRAYRAANKAEIAAKKTARDGRLCGECGEILARRSDTGLCGFCAEEQQVAA